MFEQWRASGWKKAVNALLVSARRQPASDIPTPVAEWMDLNLAFRAGKTGADETTEAIRKLDLSKVRDFTPFTTAPVGGWTLTLGRYTRDAREHWLLSA